MELGAGISGLSEAHHLAHAEQLAGREPTDRLRYRQDHFDPHALEKIRWTKEDT
ncbi:MAG: hypothetical protein HY655_06670 [Acidobacteria bacterium]|nr:hypothetical protein [Acidobacteriota bacterium]